MNRRPSSSAPAPRLEDTNLLELILLRLPPQPSYLPRAALVCRSWRSILTNPHFLSRFRKHHRKPPLIGFFEQDGRVVSPFSPILDPPDRIPHVRFSLPGKFLHGSRSIYFLGCRDGVALLVYGQPCREAILWDPITGVHCQVAFPPGLSDGVGNSIFVRSAAVRFYSARNQHVDSNYQLSPFKLVLAGNNAGSTRAFTCIYESESGVWGDITSTVTPGIAMGMIVFNRPSILVGDALHWLLAGSDILEFDLQRQTPAVIEKPADTYGIYGAFYSCQLLREDDNSLGLVVLSPKSLLEPTIIQLHLWARTSNCDGVLSWVLRRNVQLDELFSRPVSNKEAVQMPGYDEDTNVLFFLSGFHAFILQLDSMKIRYIGRRITKGSKFLSPYTTVYTGECRRILEQRE